MQLPVVAIEGEPDEHYSHRDHGARQFLGGISSTVELVQSYVSDSLVVIVKIENNKVRLAGREQPEEWVERATEVYAREGSEWKIVHRHSDPLVEHRSLAQTLALLRGQSVSD
jgi:hypothetical protein